MSKENNNDDHRSDEFLEKINEMTGEDYKTFYKYEIGISVVAAPIRRFGSHIP